MSVIKGFGERLAQERREKAARERRDIGQKDVAAAIGSSGPSVSRWESGLGVPSDRMLEKLSRYFGVTMGYLRYGQGPREYPVVSDAPQIDPNVRPLTEQDAVAIEERIHGKQVAKKSRGK